MNPYPGLRPFGEADRDFFFGREDEIDDLLLRLAERRLIAVLGVSGCGKSSLVHAGLIPILRSGLADPLSGVWRICRLAPGSDPLAALDRAAGAALPRRAHALRDWAAAQPAGQRLLVFVDQFEEVFAYRKTSLARDAGNAASLFVDALITAASDPDVPLYVVLTMRTDYLGECALFRGLSEALNDGSYLVPRLTRLRQQEAIERPAQALGVLPQAGLVQRLLNDSEGDPDRLPVLQHLLRRLWEERGEGALDLELYGKVGGWEHALERDAESVLAQFPHEQEAIARLFQWLSDSGSGDKPVRRREPVAELPAITGLAPARLDEILAAFAGRDFLHVEAGLAGFMHESVMWQWPRLKGWIAQEAEEAGRIRFLYEAAQKRILLTGVTLAESQAFRERAAAAPLWAARYLDPPEKVQQTRDWIAESARHQRDELAALRRSRRWLAVGLAAALIAVVLIAWLGWRSKQSRALTVAQIAHNDWTESRYAAEKNDAMTAMHFAADSIRRDPSFARSILLDVRAIWPQAAVVQMFQHANGVLGAVLTRDETRLLTWGADAVRLWDLRTGKQVIPPIQFSEIVLNAAFDRSETRILTRTYATIAQVWDARTGRALLPALPAKGILSGAIFDPAGTRLLTWDLKEVQLLDAASGKLLGSMQFAGQVGGAVFSRDGGRILAWSDLGPTTPGRQVRLWSADSGKQLFPPIESREYLSGAMFNRDESRIIAWGSAGTATIFDARTGRPLVPPFHYGGYMSVVQLSPDDTHIIAAGSDNAAHVWDDRTGDPVGTPLQHQAAISGILFNRDGSRVLTWSRDNTSRLWDALSGKPLTPPLVHPSSITRAAFSHDENTIVTWSADNSARLWDAHTGRLVFPPLWHQDSVNGAQFTADDKRILTWGSDGAVRLWDISVHQPLDFAVQHADTVNGAQFSDDEARFLTWSTDGTARLWDTRSGQPEGQPIRHPPSINDGGILNDGRIITFGTDNTIRIWDAVSHRSLIQPIREAESIVGLAANKDQSRILIASGNTARLWDTRTGQPLTPPLRHDGKITSGAIDPTENQILTTSSDHTARIWDARTGKQLLPSLQHQDAVGGAAFSTDGRLIVTWSADKTARIWDASNGKPAVQPMQHPAGVGAAFFNHQTTQVITISDNVIRFWDVHTGRTIAPDIVLSNGPGAAWLNRDDTLLLTWSGANIRVFGTLTQHLTIPPLNHRFEVRSAFFSEDESLIFSLTSGTDAAIWDARTGNRLGPLIQQEKNLTGYDVSKREDRIVTTGYDNTAHMWPLAIDMDFPPESVGVWLQAATGSTFDLTTRQVQPLSPEDWRAARDRYEKIAAAHAKTCRYPDFNDWLLRHKSPAAAH